MPEDKSLEEEINDVIQETAEKVASNIVFPEFPTSMKVTVTNPTEPTKVDTARLENRLELILLALSKEVEDKTLDTAVQQEIEENLALSFPIGEKSIIWLEATTNQNDTIVEGRFSGILHKNFDA